MIGGNHQQVARRHGAQQWRQERVEFFQRFCKSFHVLAVPVEHVEIHQVREDQAGLLLAERRVQLLHAVGVVFVVT